MVSVNITNYLAIFKMLYYASKSIQHLQLVYIYFCYEKYYIFLKSIIIEN